MRRAGRGRVLAAVGGAIAVALSACSAGTTSGSSSSEVDFAAVRAAREAFAGPAQELGTAARAAVASGRLARFEIDASAADGTPDVAERTFLIDEFEARLDEVDSANVEVSVEADADVEAATEAWAQARRDATQLVASGRAEVLMLRALLDAEAVLAGLAALWDEAGSRAQQTERLNDAVELAEGVVASLAEVEDIPSCATAVERRREAARLVADRTAELAGHVARGQGTAFDEARASYDLEPWHQGLAQMDGNDEACWGRQAGVSTGAAAVEAAIEDLVEALNPTTSDDPTVGLPLSPRSGS